MSNYQIMLSPYSSTRYEKIYGVCFIDQSKAVDTITQSC